jgi:predicted metal-dependent hydrolase
MDPSVTHGIHLFNNRKFFEAHEALEEVWLKTQGEEKIFLHGLIQIAAAFHHRARRNSGGFRSLLEKGLNKLERLDGSRGDIDLGSLCGQLERWRDFLNHQGSISEHPPLPRILMR